LKEIRIEGKYRVEKRNKDIKTYYVGERGNKIAFVVYWRGGLERVVIDKKDVDHPLAWPLFAFCVNLG